MPTTCECLLTSIKKKRNQNSRVDQRQAAGCRAGNLTEGGKNKSMRLKETEKNGEKLKLREGYANKRRLCNEKSSY